jgi:hypothetical protein
MRALEFLREYDADISDKDLKAQIKDKIDIETDRVTLDRVYQALDRANIDEKLLSAISRDPDMKVGVVKKLKDYIIRIIMTTQGSTQDKKDFIATLESGKGFIDTDKLLTKNQIVNVKDLLLGNNDFADKVFMELLEMPIPQGVGPGEIPMALLSPKIKIVGGSKEAPGDLQIGKKFVEVKAEKDGTPGRLSDDKVKINFSKSVDMIRKAGITDKRIALYPGKLAVKEGERVNVVGENSVVERFKANGIDVKPLADTIANELNAGRESKEDKKLEKELSLAIQENDPKEVMIQNTKLQLGMYKSAKKFDGMLFLNVKNRDNVYSYYTEDNSFDSINIDSGTIYMTGSGGKHNTTDREMKPAIGLRGAKQQQEPAVDSEQELNDPNATVGNQTAK